MSRYLKQSLMLLLCFWTGFMPVLAAAMGPCVHKPAAHAAVAVVEMTEMHHQHHADHQMSVKADVQADHATTHASCHCGLGCDMPGCVGLAALPPNTALASAFYADGSLRSVLHQTAALAAHGHGLIRPPSRS